MPFSRERLEKSFKHWKSQKRNHKTKSFWYYGFYIIFKENKRKATWIPFWNIFVPGEVIYIGAGRIYKDVNKELKLDSRAHKSHFKELDNLICSNPDKYVIAILPEILSEQAFALEAKMIEYFHNEVGLAFYGEQKDGEKFFYNKREEFEQCDKANDLLNLKEFKYESC